MMAEYSDELEINEDYEIKDELPLIPLRGTIVFPYMVIPLDVGRERSINAVEEAMLHDRIIVLAAQKDSTKEDPDMDDIYKVGTAAEIKQLLKIPNGAIRILVEGLKRVEIGDAIQQDPYFEVRVQPMEESDRVNSEIEALMRTVIYQFEQYVKLSKKVPIEVIAPVAEIDDPGRLVDIVASHLVLKVGQKQQILQVVNPKKRLELLCSILTKEIEILEIERKVHLRVKKQMEKTQKEYYLREQLKAIQKELGEKDEKTAEIEEFKEKIEKNKLPAEVKKRALEEVDRLEKIPPMSAETVVVRNYLDWVLSLPWSTRTRDRLSMAKAERILDEDHYGLEKVKERIIEYLAVRKLSKKTSSTIMCLVGPPGVGKTSLAKSVARAMNRKFVRFSLGGVRDEAEIRGHRRTYVGALPGKIIQVMRKAGSKNPVILLDEVDKMSMDFRGDPSAALLEVLDPEQNREFQDHYIEVPFDLSSVMFITTANVLYQIPAPLQDRMEIITIPGYTEEEKIAIAQNFLVPKQIEENGLKTSNVEFSEDSLKKLIRDYTREAGVRELERNISSICRKVARHVLKKDNDMIQLSHEKIEEYLGVAKYRKNTTEKNDQVGLSTGLAWTQTGGDILQIESSVVKGKGNVKLTGKLGDVMKESAEAAFSYIRSRAEALGLEEGFNEKYDVHVHVPEGAISKDGPSAGITIAASLISALTNKPVKSDMAMTGEITLRGRVLSIGGLKEKTLAAHRMGIKKILLPEENKKDLQDIPENVRNEMEFLFVKHMDEVIEKAIANR